MTSKYEVLLERSNGHNKTVIINDCYSSQEAEERAEAMYGMPVLRVLYRGRSDQWHTPPCKVAVFVYY